MREAHIGGATQNMEHLNSEQDSLPISSAAESPSLATWLPLAIVACLRHELLLPPAGPHYHSLKYVIFFLNKFNQMKLIFMVNVKIMCVSYHNRVNIWKYMYKEFNRDIN